MPFLQSDFIDDTELPENPVRDLLLASARVSLGSNEPSTIAKLLESPEMDWDDLLRLAHEHGTLPLLNRVLGRLIPETVPPPFLRQVRERSQGNAHRNLMLLQSLLQLIHRMRNVGVRVLPYKGPMLAMTAYGDASMRECGDLDLIVPEGDLPAAQAVLEAAGFRQMDEPGLGDDPSNATAHEYHLTYMNPDRSITIELHWEVVGQLFSVHLDPVDLWHRSQSRPIAGMQVQMLSPEDELLVLCVHGTKHYWTRLTWICDIAQCLKLNPRIDWNLLLDRAAKEDARGMLILAILLSNEVLATPVPQQIRAASKAVHHAGARELAERLFCDHAAAAAAAPVRGSCMQLTDGSMLASLMFHMKMRDRWTSGVRYCLHRTFTPTAVDYGHTRLPRPLRFMYYLLRPLRLLGKYAPWSRGQVDVAETADVTEQDVPVVQST
jgi:hypothetical protein